jgi:hypothetical protein
VSPCDLLNIGGGFPFITSETEVLAAAISSGKKTVIHAKVKIDAF